MKPTINQAQVGQDFDEFLKDDGIAAEVEARAIKKVVVALLESAGLSQVKLAAHLQTNRTQVRRLLDPENTSITLSTLQRGATSGCVSPPLSFNARLVGVATFQAKAAELSRRLEV